MPVMLPTELQRQLDRLIAQAEACAEASGLPGLASRTWLLPEGVPSGVDIQDPNAFKVAVERYQLNQLYREALESGSVQNGGTLAELVAFKSAIDYLAAFERALHARFASRVRCAAWAAARRAGHGDAAYGVFAAIAKDVVGTLASAGTPGAP